MSSDEMTTADTDEPQKPHDPEDYVTERRLKDIYDARQELLNTRRQAAKLEIEADTRRRSGRYKASAVKLHRSAIENYLLELQPLFENFGGSNLWESKHYGTMRAEPPQAQITQPKHMVGKFYEIEHNGQIITVEDPLPSARTVVIRGYNTLFSEPSPIVVPFQYNVNARGENRTVTKTTECYMGKGILDRMLSSANAFLARHGLELDPDDTNRDIQFDYSDIS